MNDPMYEKQKTHYASLRAGKAFASAYKNNAENTLDLLEKYVELRREIPKDSDGRRFGSAAAFYSTQGYEV